MRIDPQIAALRGDPASQLRAQAKVKRAVNDWKQLPEMTPLLQQFARYAAGDALEALSDLHALLNSHTNASGFVERWCAHFSASLCDAPLAQMPFRHSWSSGFATLRLLAEHGASLSLLVYEEVARPIVPQSAIFSDREQHEIVLSGEGRGLLCDREAASSPVRTAPLALKPGDTLSLQCRAQTRQLVEVEGRMVVLQLARTPEQPRPTQEIRLGDGELLLQSDGDKRVSQSSMALAVLGALGRKDAVPTMERLCGEGPAHLRWEALRQMLTLDPFRGIAALDRIAACQEDELAAPARALAVQLREQYPTLRTEDAA